MPQTNIYTVSEAFGCTGCGGTNSTSPQRSDRVSLTPPFVVFLHDQPEGNVVEITLWNRTLAHMQVQLEPLQETNVFHAVCDKKGVYGGSQITIGVKCSPAGRKLASDCLRIRTTSYSTDGLVTSEILSLPLQLCPGRAWLSFPKVVVMPPVSIGNTVEMTVPLPEAPEPEKFFVAVTSTPQHSHAVTVSPFSGVLGGPNSTRELLIGYSPKEYTTLVHVVQLHFPGVGITPHEIVVYGRAVPGVESEVITRETVELENFVAMARKNKIALENRKLPELKMKIKVQSPRAEEEGCDFPDLGMEEDLTKPAGVMHFLLRKGDGHENATTLGPTGLTLAQERKAYLQLETNFKGKVNREKIKQKNIHAQNSTPQLGGDPITNGSQVGKGIIEERDLQRSRYEQELLGVNNNEDKDQNVNKSKLKVSNQRNVRRVGDQILGKPEQSEDEIAEIEREGRRISRQLVLSRFIQCAYVIMMRYRVSKRIPKLRLLIRDLKAAKQLRSAREGR